MSPMLPRLARSFSLAATLVAVTSCSETSSIDPTLEPAALSSRRWHASGTRILDELGRETVLRGFNASGRSKMAPFHPFDVAPGETFEQAADAYFGRIEALGANTVRLIFGWEALESVRGTYDTAYVADYRRLLDAAHAHRLSVFVDFHQDVFASPFCGDGFPLWALGDIPHGPPRYDCGFPGWSDSGFVTTSPTSQAFDRFWSNEDGLQDDFEAMWRYFAAAVADHPAVGGFDMFNEPAAGSTPLATFDTTVLPAFHARIGAAIREAAGDVMVFGCTRLGDSLGEPTMLGAPTPALSGHGFSPHYYHGLTTIGFGDLLTEDIRQDLENTLAPSQAWNVPVILGEFGAPNSSPIKAEYLDLIFDVLDEQVAHGMMWEAGVSEVEWNGEDFSVFDTSGNERPWAASVVRAYPRAVSGHIVRFAWDAETKHFELDVEDAGDEVTEIEAPTRHLGSRPRIRVTGGARYRFVPTRNLLLVRAAPGSTYSVSIDPR